MYRVKQTTQNFQTNNNNSTVLDQNTDQVQDWMMNICY